MSIKRDDLDSVVEKGHELLQMLLTLQSEKDGVDRPVLFSVDKSKTLDQLTLDTNVIATYISSLMKLIPMQVELSNLGRKLVAEGRISAEITDSYAELALKYYRTNM